MITYPALRVRGHYVAIATLGIGQIVAFTLLNWESVTRGPLGVSNIPPITLFGFAIVRPADFYWLALGTSILVALLIWQLTRSHLGRSWRGIREDETAALTSRRPGGPLQDAGVRRRVRPSPGWAGR